MMSQLKKRLTKKNNLFNKTPFYEGSFVERNKMEKVLEILKNESKFIVTSHVNPDGDNLGSSIGLVRYLSRIGKEAYHVIDDQMPDNMKFLLDSLEGEESHHIFTTKEFLYLDWYKEMIDSGDFVLIVVDCADRHRVSLGQEILEGAKKIVNLDHHISNTNYGDINLVEGSLSSTCELVTSLLREMGEAIFDKSMATALYTGLSTDTGNFLFDSVTDKTFETASFLTKMGADRDTVANKLYQSTSFNYLKLTREVLETLELHEEVGLMVLTQEMLDRNQVEYKDTDDLVNNVINIDVVKVGILIKEKGKEEYKISLRSKDDTNVCKIAQKFHGGGHKRASGCTLHGDLSKVKYEIIQASKEQLCIKDL